MRSPPNKIKINAGGGRRGRDHNWQSIVWSRWCRCMVVGFTITYALIAYHNLKVWVQIPLMAMCTILCDKVCHWQLRKVGGFLRSIHQYNWIIVESGDKHNNPYCRTIYFQINLLWKIAVVIYSFLIIQEPCQHPSRIT